MTIVFCVVFAVLALFLFASLSIVGKELRATKEKLRMVKAQLGQPIEMERLPFGKYFISHRVLLSALRGTIYLMREEGSDAYWLVYTKQKLPERFSWHVGQDKVFTAVPVTA